VLPDVNRVRYLAGRTRVLAPYLLSVLRARSAGPGAVAVIGAYHHRNLGDMTLARAVCRSLDSAGRGHTVRDVHRLHHYPSADSAVFGGGATGVPGLLESFCVRPDAEPRRTVFAGMDFQADVDRFPPRVLQFLSFAGAISVRSRRQRERLRRQLNREDVAFQWDLAFASGLLEAAPRLRERNHLVFGVNVLPFFMQWGGGRFRPGHALEQWYRSTGSDIAPHVGALGPAYVDFVRAVVSGYASRGYRVKHIPFALEDDWFARECLAGTAVEFCPFTLRPRTILRQLGSCSLFLATRFHAHVYALMAGVPLLSFQYAEKVRDLWDDLCLPGEASVQRMELVRSPESPLDKGLGGSPAAIPFARRAALEREAQESLASLLSALPGKNAREHAA